LSNPPRGLPRSYLVGPYLEDEPIEGDLPPGGCGIISSPLLDTQRTLAFLLGQHASRLAHLMTPSAAETKALTWLNAPFLQGGLQILLPPDPFEEDKGEVRSSNSTPGLRFFKYLN